MEMKLFWQEFLEEKYSKNQKRKLLKKEFNSKEFNDTELDILAVLLEQDELYVSTLIEILVEKSTEEVTKASIVEITEGILSLLEKEEVGYLVNGSNTKLISKYVPNDYLYNRLKELKSLPPMIVKPNEVTSNRGSGYLTIRKDSLILGNSVFNHHNYDICLEIINMLNSINFCLNTNVIDHGTNKWNNLEDEKNRIAFNRFQKDSYQTMKEMIKYGNSFWFTHKYDKRGRMYPVGYYLTYQGNDFGKAILELTDKKYISDEVIF